MKRLIALNAKWLKSTVDQIPASGNGVWSPRAGAVSPWMDAFVVLGCYTAYDRTKDANWLVPAEFTAKAADPWAECDCLGHANAYRAVC